MYDWTRAAERAETIMQRWLELLEQPLTNIAGCRERLDAWENELREMQSMTQLPEYKYLPHDDPIWPDIERIRQIYAELVTRHVK